MNIYSVKFDYVFEVPEHDDIPAHNHVDEGKVELGAIDLPSAYLEADEFLEQHFDLGFEIKSIKLLEKVMIVNWPGDGEDCQCPFCRTERAAPEDLITFQCKCGENYTLVDDFGSIVCPKCNQTINRQDLIGHNGNYTFIDI